MLATNLDQEIVGSSHIPVGPIGDNNSVRGNQRKKVERWNFSTSPKKDQIGYTIFGNLFKITEREREREMERREREKNA